MTYIVAGSAGINLAEGLSKLTGYPLIQVERKTFSDGETYFRIQEETDNDHEVIIVQSLYAPQEFHLFELLNLASTFRNRGHEKITAVAPYLCYARADREVRGGDVISSRTVLELIAGIGVSKLICIDLHNPSIVQYSPKDLEIINIIPAKAFADYFRDRYQIDEDLWEVIAPDQGALVRAELLAKFLKVSYNSLHKSRDPVTGRISYSTDPDFTCKPNIILVDDITSSGTSLKHSAEILRYHGASIVHIVVSHLMSTVAVDSLREISGGEFVATESVPSPVSIVKLAELIGEEL